MAGPNDFTGQNIQDTYQRVLQTSGSGNIVDGTGSIFIPSTASYAHSASYATSASYEINYETSSSYAETASYVNPLNQDVTASGNVSVIGGDVSIGANQEFKVNTYNTVLTNNSLRLYGGAYISGRNSANGSFVTIGTNTGGNSFGFARLGVKGTGLGATQHIFEAQDSSDNSIFAISNNGHITASGNISSSASSTASFGTYLGDGSSLTGISSTPFPFTGDAQITGSLTVSGSVVDFMSASAINLDIEKIPLVNPMVEYFDVGLITGSGTTITLPNSLTYVSSSVYEYLEVFVNGLRLRYNRDFIPMSNTSIKYNITIVSGSEVTYKSLKRP